MEAKLILGQISLLIILFKLYVEMSKIEYIILSSFMAQADIL